MKRRSVWRSIAIAAAVVLILAVIIGSFAFRMRGGMFFSHRADMFRGHGTSFYGRGMPKHGAGAGLFFGLLLIGGLVWLFVHRMRAGTICGDSPEEQAQPTSDDAAMVLLRQRYASGEIDDEEFQRIKSGLEG